MRFIIFLLFLLVTLGGRWYYVCEVKQLCDDEPVIEVPKIERLKNLTLKDGNQVILEGYEQLAFDSGSIIPVLSPNNKEFFDGLAKYLKDNPDKNLTITGKYRDSEKGLTSGMFENLGVARANAIREQLIKRGIDQKRISLDFNSSADRDLKEPAEFSLFVPVDDTPEDYDKVQYSFEDMTFSEANFEYNSAEFKPQEQFLLYADSVRTYLESEPEKKLIVIGHTDSIGGDAYNYNLGMNRAKSAKEYFIEMGITSEIQIDSKGRLNPMDTNDTEEGRQKNRRVNFKIE